MNVLYLLQKLTKNDQNKDIIIRVTDSTVYVRKLECTVEDGNRQEMVYRCTVDEECMTITSKLYDTAVMEIK